MGRRFSATHQPSPAKRRGGRKPKVKFAEAVGGWEKIGPEVTRLAEQGVEQADIAVCLGLTGRLQAEADLARKFEELVATGHAQHRARTAMLVRSEAEKGRSNPLMGLAKAWLDRYAEEQLTPEEEVGIVERVVELVEQRKAQRHATAEAV